MTTQYAADAAGALVDIRSAGAAVTFTRSVLAQNGASGEPTGMSTTAVAGYAIRVKGNPMVYAALGLTQMDVETLMFAPSTAGATPALGSSATWNGITFAVKSVEAIAPDGQTLLARVVMAR